MDRIRKEVYREGITHITKMHPYSLWKNYFAENNKDALYLHWHPEIEICYVEKGALDFYIEDVCYPVEEGTAIFIPPNLLHRAASRKQAGGMFYALVFSTDFIATPAQPAPFQKYVQPVLQNPADFCIILSEKVPWQKAMMGDLLRLFSEEEQEQDSSLLLKGLLQVLWQNLYNHHIQKVAKSQPACRLEPQVQEAIRFIHAHFQEDISLEALAGVSHVSEGQLCRSFKQLTGNTPFTYLKRYRIQKSCAYLAESDKKISEICMLCGFNNISYFNREFLRMLKVTPSVYRAQCRKGNDI